jgi:signal peptidase I
MAKAPTLKKRNAGGLVENAKTIIYAGLIAIGIRTFVVEPFNIPSGSMIPTLLIGDFLFVSKFSYGYSRFSFPYSPPLFSGRLFGSMPKRGDVAVFKYPRDDSTDYIKRIIGLPGDRVQMRGGQLWVNGVEVPRQADGEFTVTGDGPPTVLRRYIETLPDSGLKHPILKASDNEALDNTQEFHVPEDHFFAMGDNRDNSSDSRIITDVGFIPIDNLVGRAEFIFFSVDATAPWWEVWKWPVEVRWSRLFSPIR